MVTKLIQPDTEDIAAFCRKWKITEFSLFGSVLRDDFNADSDVDVLVSFAKGAAWGLWDIGDMREELQLMFGRPVDIVEKDALRNPFRKQDILSQHKVLYAA